MDLSENSNGTDKSWDHPWTTDEMRQHRNDWSLAADAGLLKHLQQFSDNLAERIQKSQEQLNSLTGELDEASVVIDNVTNASLALANTQFIESRVYEDDIEIKQPQEISDKETKNEQLNEEDLIACVSENIKQGLSIMDEKFQRLEVLPSDSEDEGDVPTPSVVLKPKDPYQNRPLPYVIGSEKWKASSKVGLESSSSDSEPPDGDEDSGSEDDKKIDQSIMIPSHRNESLRRSSSSSSESSDRKDRRNNANHYSNVSSRTEKLEARSQDTLNSGSEIATPIVVQSRPDNLGKGAPSFAEELAKRLGNVLPSNRPIQETHDIDQSSINRFEDDLFAPDNHDVFGSKSENLFSGTDNLFEDDVSTNLWKDKPYRPPKTNTIPPSIDVPPPMHTEVKKQNSAFDDLYGDADSESSDDIFAPKNTQKTLPRNSTLQNNDQRESSDSRENKLLKIARSESNANMATSTPETNDTVGLFGDENSEENNDDLFGDSVKSRRKITERSPELARATRTMNPPEISITQADILSSNLGSRLFQSVRRQDSSDSSDTESSVHDDDARANDAIVRESDSSGISIAPNSFHSTLALSAEFQPQSESTRLKSEDIYRERTASDSLFDGRSRQPENTNSSNNSSNTRRLETRIREILHSHREEDFDSDDVFGPPPLIAKQSDSKSKHDITTAEDLFSTSSSGSRSQKSFDLLAANESQYETKSTTGRSGGLFDEDIDIFGSRDAPDVDIFGTREAPDVDIFGEGFKSGLAPKEASGSSLNFPKETSVTSAATSKVDLFNETATDVEESILSRTGLKKSVHKPNSIFDDSEDDDDDLFGPNFLKSARKPRVMLEVEDDKLFANSSKSTGERALEETKKDSRGVVERADGANESLTRREEKWDSDQPVIESSLPSYTAGGLFDNLDDDADDDADDNDSLFNNKKTDPLRDNAAKKKVAKKFANENEKLDEPRTEENEFKTNCAKIEGLLKDQTVREPSGEKSVGRENESRFATDTSMSEKSVETTTTKEDSSSDSEKRSRNEKKDVTVTDGGKISKPRDSSEVGSETITKRHPPKTLSIRLPIPSATDDSVQAPRRAVSGKIKNLMGKMGDLKILSPTDAPPLWRKPEDKSDGDEERAESRDSEDGSSMSAPSTKSPSIISNKTEDINIFADASKEPPLPSSPLDDSGNSESAVSFDVPAQVEVLAVTASKSRARIQAKRRPQSRHARQSALRKSGIDFDTVDNSGTEAVESDPSDNTFFGISDKIPTVVADPIDVPKTGNDRLAGTDVDVTRVLTDKTTETSGTLAPEDRSEMSYSKGSSLSLNKNTLLSPSTDEEDLFDVPPDLPEDPPKEDTLFGRAPILSPIDRILGSKKSRSEDKSGESRIRADVAVKTTRDSESHKTNESTKEVAKEKNTHDRSAEKDKINVEKNSESASLAEKPTDPLRDSSHDPLKDPSQLFAFVTKTPSPEKGQNALFKEDASLFTHVAKKSAEEAAKAASKKSVMDLFADDTGGDLFSGQLAKSSKKSTKNTRNSLFDDMDTDEDSANDLFGSGARAKIKEKVETIDDSVANKSTETSGRASPSHSSLFAHDVDDDLFAATRDKKFSPEPENSMAEDSEKRLFPTTSKIAKDVKIRDIFGDQSSGEEDIFGTGKTIGTGKVVGAGGSIFSGDISDDDVNDIFGKKETMKSRKTEPIENRSSAKKNVTRDLKKTAEKIVEDPLSMLQDD